MNTVSRSAEHSRFPLLTYQLNRHIYMCITAYNLRTGLRTPGRRPTYRPIPTCQPVCSRPACLSVRPPATEPPAENLKRRGHCPIDSGPHLKIQSVLPPWNPVKHWKYPTYMCWFYCGCKYSNYVVGVRTYLLDSSQDLIQSQLSYYYSHIQPCIVWNIATCITSIAVKIQPISPSVPVRK